MIQFLLVTMKFKCITNKSQIVVTNKMEEKWEFLMEIKAFFISNIKGKINGHYSQIKSVTSRPSVSRSSKSKSSK